MILLDILGCNIVIMGEEFFCSNRWGSEEEDAVNTIPVFDEAEKTSELTVVYSNDSIPTKRIAYFGTAYNQQISVMMICGEHKDKVLTYSLENVNQKKVFKIMIEIDISRNIHGFIKDIKNNSVIWEFAL